jgi:hypothetical protein
LVNIHHIEKCFEIIFLILIMSHLYILLYKLIVYIVSLSYVNLALVNIVELVFKVDRQETEHKMCRSRYKRVSA